MTAFARGQHSGNVGQLTCEIRSVNHRYLDISIYLPDNLRSLEMPMRELIRQLIKRGKIECSIRYQPSPHEVNALFTINTVLAKALCEASETIGAFLRQITPSSPIDILRFPGVIETKETDTKTVQKELLQLLEETLKDLLLAREREGKELNQFFLQRLDLLQVELKNIRKALPRVLKDQKNRLLQRFVEVKIELQPERLEQEMVLFAQKIDVAEEIERTETHIIEIRRVLQQNEAIGRRLDFLLQELNREANTLASKSVDSVITHAALQMKVLIEQVREQVQNVE